jgi:tetratricopeptide (TPR) repeat protein
MPDPTGSDARLQSLRRRWEVEKSTAFLPLAEEYRRLGRLREAIEVLETGLKSNPGYTSGLVALGRCRLESGDSVGAVQVLERVVKQDPEQMVASKLLIEAYLRTGRTADARSRLQIYTGLNAKDPEIARLQERLTALQQQAAPPPPHFVPAPAVSAAEPVGLAVAGAETPDLAASLAPAAAQRPGMAEPAADAGAIFVGLDGLAVVSRYLRGLAAEGIFPLAFPRPRAVARRAVQAAPAVDWRDAPTLEQPAFSAPRPPLPSDPVPAVEAEPATPSEVESLSAIEIEPLPDAPPIRLGAQPIRSEPAAILVPPEHFDADVERAVSDLVPVPPPSAVVPTEPALGAVVEIPPPAPQTASATAPETATLGDLYLRQGYPAEAERIFGAVLERDPANDLARRGLDQAQEAQRQPPVGLSGRRARALRDFLGRLRRGASHVS